MKNTLLCSTVLITLSIGSTTALSQDAGDSRTYLPDFPPWAKIIKQLPNPVHIRTIRVDGRAHDYRVYVPNHSEPLPLLLVFPGSNSSGEDQIRHFAPHAEKEKFIAVWPRWDIELRKRVLETGKLKGREAGRRAATKASKTEVARMRLIVDDVATQARVDQSRIFASGSSAGGRFCYELAAHASDMIAGIAPSISAMPTILEAPPKYPVSMLSIIGEKDSRIASLAERGYLAETETMMETYLKLNGIQGEPVVSRFPDKDKNDGMSVRIEQYRPGISGVRVEVWVVEGGNHAAHGMPEEGNRNPRHTNIRCLDFYRPEIVWEFFKNCPLRKLGNQ